MTDERLMTAEEWADYIDQHGTGDLIGRVVGLEVDVRRLRKELERRTAWPLDDDMKLYIRENYHMNCKHFAQIDESLRRKIVNHVGAILDSNEELERDLAEAREERDKMAEHFHSCSLCTDCYVECNGDDPPAVQRAREQGDDV
jgi:hypothetical protein